MFENIYTTYSGWQLDLPDVSYCGHFFNDSRVVCFISKDKNYIYQTRNYISSNEMFTEGKYFEYVNTFSTVFEYSSCNKKSRALIKLKGLDVPVITSLSDTSDVAWETEINQERYRIAIQGFLNCSKV